jgi:hypothetical protein
MMMDSHTKMFTQCSKTVLLVINFGNTPNAHQLMNKQKLYPYNGILFNNKNIHTTMPQYVWNLNVSLLSKRADIRHT